ncbi:MAG: hypothetical protein R3E03_00585 [Novosphingobium sp.]
MSTPSPASWCPTKLGWVSVFRYVKPRATKWPKADFIVGNPPPFIGSKDVRDRLGDGYFKALFATTDVPESADFVIIGGTRRQPPCAIRHAPVRLPSPPIRLRESFSRRVIAKHLDAKDRVSLLFAIPNHPRWTRRMEPPCASP